MVLVSILGDFHSSILPMFFEFKDQIKKHILVYDDYKHDVKEAKTIIRGLKKFNEKYNLNIKTITHCIDEDSLDALFNLKIVIENNTKKKDEVYINTTDGLSNINSFLSKELISKGYKFISYDRFDNTANIITDTKMYSYSFKKPISVKDHFLLKDIDIKSIVDKEFVHKFEMQIISLFEKYYDDFIYYLDVDRGIEKLKSEEYHKINSLLISMGYTNKEKSAKLSKNKRKNIRALRSGELFEYYIYLKLRKLNCDDMQIGVKVSKNVKFKYAILNEFDILIMKDHHLHMVECKFRNDFHQNDLVYKYMGLRHMLDDDSKMCLVTMHDNPNNMFGNSPHIRASDNNMLLLGNPLENINDFVSKVEDFLEL
jgi:hypothetical protein